ncbi:MAG: hypothetical protein WDN31_00225 [Hyphomicrobium sp.]
MKSATFSPDGAHVLTASSDTTARIWDASSGKILAQLRHDAIVNRAYFSSDGRRVVTASDDTTAKLWDAETGKELVRINHDDKVRDATFSTNGFRVVTNDGTARVCTPTAAGKSPPSAKTGWLGALRSVPTAPRSLLLRRTRWRGFGTPAAARSWPASVTMKEFMGPFSSPNGTRLATASQDRTARLWDVISGKELARFDHADAVWTILFSGDGSQLVTSAGNAAFAWQAFRTTQDLVNAAKARAPRCLTRKERAAYFLTEAPPLWCVERRLWPYQSDEWQTWLAARNTGSDAVLPPTVD